MPRPPAPPPSAAKPGGPRPPGTKPGKKSLINSQDTLVALIAAGVVLIAAVAGTTMYLNVSVERDAGVAYTNFDPVNIKTRGFALRASIAIQTRAGKSDWARKNKSRLDSVFQRTLSEAEPTLLRSSTGIEALQAKLRDDANRALGTDNLEAVYVTDLLLMNESE